MADRPQSGTIPESAEQTGGALPNLIIIGALKCGTTSLHHYLAEALGDDAERLRAFAGRTFPGWTV